MQPHAPINSLLVWGRAPGTSDGADLDYDSLSARTTDSGDEPDPDEHIDR